MDGRPSGRHRDLVERALALHFIAQGAHIILAGDLAGPRAVALREGEDGDPAPEAVLRLLGDLRRAARARRVDAIRARVEEGRRHVTIRYEAATAISPRLLIPDAR